MNLSFTGSTLHLCFYWLRLLRRVCSLDVESVIIVVKICADYCNAVLAGAQKMPLTSYSACCSTASGWCLKVWMSTDISAAFQQHWLVISDWVWRYITLVWLSRVCLQHDAPQYLWDCILASEVASCRYHQSTTCDCQQLLIPHCGLSMFCCHCQPSLWVARRCVVPAVSVSCYCGWPDSVEFLLSLSAVTVGGPPVCSSYCHCRLLLWLARQCGIPAVNVGVIMAWSSCCQCQPLLSVAWQWSSCCHCQLWLWVARQCGVPSVTAVVWRCGVPAVTVSRHCGWYDGVEFLLSLSAVTVGGPTVWSSCCHC